MDNFTFRDFLFRLIAAFALVLLTFNPTGYSYLQWVAEVFPKINAFQAVAGIVLIIGWIVFVVATLRSIGFLGVLLVTVLLAALVWLLVSMGWLTLQGSHSMSWIALIALSIILAVGMSWSFVSRRLTGQVDVDEADTK